MSQGKSLTHLLFFLKKFIKHVLNTKLWSEYLMEVRVMDELNKGPNQENNNRQFKWNKVSKSLKKIVYKDGFYIILFICICIVTTTAVWVSKNNIDSSREYEINEYTDIVDSFDDYINFEEIEEANVDENPNVAIIEIDKSVKETKDNEVAASEEQKTNAIPASSSLAEQSEQIAGAMALPVMGNIIMDYAEDKLVYSKTLEQWTTHKGIDFKASEGTVVKAALDGVVSQIKKDEALGIVITLDHGNGLQTRYGNLSTDEMVEVGKEVKKGDAISGVGKGSGYEMVEGPHLHFEIIQDGKNIDPKQFLPKFKND